MYGEDAPANATGTAVAGTGDDSSTVIVRKRKEMKDKLNIKRFNKKNEKMLDSLCEAIVCSTEIENWTQKAFSCVSNLEEIQKLDVKSKILEIAAEHELDNYSAAILYHSNNKNEETQA